MTLSVLRRLAVAAAVLSLFLTSGGAAQETPTTMVVGIGEIVEIQAVGAQSISWNLTMSDLFVQAGQGGIFHTRLFNEGLYTLRVEGSGRNGPFTKSIALDVRSAVPERIPTSLESVPPMVGRTVDLSSASLWRVFPPTGTKLRLDLDAQGDSDGDGLTENDIDNPDTFALTEGLPLALWFIDPPATFSVIAEIRGADGVPQTETLLMRTAGEPTAGGNRDPLTSTSIAVRKYSDTTYGFSLDESGITLPETPLLYQWDFGDGTQSLQDQPLHTFAGSGTYSVVLTLRDLTNGSELLTQRGTLTIAGAPPAPAQSSSQAQEPTDDATGGFLSSATLQVIVIGFASVVIGLLLMYAISTLLKKYVIERQERTESEAASPPPAGPQVLDTAPPMPVIDVTASVKERKEPAKPESMKPALTPLHIDESKAPAWLKQGLESSPTTPPSPAPPPAAAPARYVPPPAPPARPPVPPTPPTPEPKSSLPQKPPSESKPSAPLPPWLQPSPAPTPEKPKPQPPTPPSLPESPAPRPAPVPSPVEPRKSEAPEPKVEKIHPPAPNPAVKEPAQKPPAEPPPPAKEPPPATPPAPPGPVAAPPVKPVSVKRLDEQPKPEPPVQVPQTPESKIAPPVDEDVSPEERERRRKKRQRYRANKRKREEAAIQEESPESEEQPESPPQKKSESPVKTPQPEQPLSKTASQPILPNEEDDEPYAIIRAEDLTQTQDETSQSGDTPIKD